MFIITPVTTPKPLLSGFVPLSSQSEINRIDALRIHDTAKFAEAANFGPFGVIAYQHIHQAFAFKLPPQVALEIQGLGLPIHITGELEGFVIEGLMSASLWTWREFVIRATHKDQSEWLIKCARQMYDAHFRLLPYFTDALK
jgi:hypothetical protein